MQSLLFEVFPGKTVNEIANILDTVLNSQDVPSEEKFDALRFSLVCLLEWYRHLFRRGSLFHEISLGDMFFALETELLSSDLSSIEEMKRVVENLSQQIWTNLKRLSDDEVSDVIRGLVVKSLNLLASEFKEEKEKS